MRSTASDDDECPPKILLAEDQAQMRSMVAELLRGRGYDVVELRDGPSLTRELYASTADDDNPTEPALLISDVRMPNGSGLEALRAIRRTHQTLPVIVMTAFGDPQLHREAHALGATHVFDKPFDLSDLLAEVERVLSR